jgi:Kef-type K+ transport system membrane component KefB
VFESQSIVSALFLIFMGAALVATLALFVRQALIIGYILLGALLGPWGVGWVTDTALITNLAEFGIIFLLFLLGLNLAPQKLWLLLQQTLLVTLLSSVVFGLAGGAISLAFGFTLPESALVGVAAMFSSTIVGIKLLPTTVLHHRHTGEIIISVLLLQDLIAIIVLLALQGLETGAVSWLGFGRLALALPLLIGVAFLAERYVLMPLFRRFDSVQEYVFLLTLAWCLGVAQLAHSAGLSYEIGAFVGGVVVATSPISLFIAESLKPLRDFFLVMFFFALGASLDLDLASRVLLPAAVLGGVMLLLKPLVFRYALSGLAESGPLAWETGWRLGQLSEFSLLITFLAMQSALIGKEVVLVIQLATLITFIGSSTIVVMRFPTPVAASARLRRD